MAKKKNTLPVWMRDYDKRIAAAKKSCNGVRDAGNAVIAQMNMQGELIDDLRTEIDELVNCAEEDQRTIDELHKQLAKKGHEFRVVLEAVPGESLGDVCLRARKIGYGFVCHNDRVHSAS